MGNAESHEATDPAAEMRQIIKESRDKEYARLLILKEKRANAATKAGAKNGQTTKPPSNVTSRAQESNVSDEEGEVSDSERENGVLAVWETPKEPARVSAPPAKAPAQQATPIPKPAETLARQTVAPAQQAKSAYKPTKTPADSDSRAEASKQQADSASKLSAPSKRTSLPIATKDAGKTRKRSALDPWEGSNKIKRQKLTSTASKPSPGSGADSPLPVSAAVHPSVSAPGQARGPPEWYTNINAKDLEKYRGDPNAEPQLRKLKADIAKYKQLAKQDGDVPKKNFTEIRKLLHVLAFAEVEDKLIRRTRVLHNEEGLPQLFDATYTGKVRWPWDIKADAEELYNRWYAGIFDARVYRGLIPPKKATKHGNDRSATRLDPAVPRLYLVQPKAFGNGNLLNGQWWPIQLAALRDGAVSSTQAGISGIPGKGATAVIMAGGVDSSNQKYPDEDGGDEVLYCGTDSNTGKPTELTQLLKDTVEQKGEPVRLIRSSNLKSTFAPKAGFRYDGLYKVVGFEILDAPDSKRQRHRFRLRRLQGQDPVRGGDGDERRPTEQELEAYRKERKLMGFD